VVAVRRVLIAVVAVLLAAGCQAKPGAPGPAEMRTGPPPWDAPRDAVSYIDAAGMERLPLDFRGPAPYYFKVTVTVDDASVTVPGGIGLDPIRAEQAPMHTHAADGIVSVEARTKQQRPTLRQFFTLWGVRYDQRCLGDACGGVTVAVDGVPAAWDLPLPPESLVEVAAKHG
jgi:hypothetical protein